MSPESGSNPLVMFVPFLVVLSIFYLLVMKPEKQKQNERKNRLANLKKNDEVVTSGGIHGVVVNVKQTTIIVRVDDNVRLEMDKDAIVTIKNSTSS